uniref:Transposase, mutator type n=1 Tax=Tanacetum cinerariifolium TaxID=118510 RepID=A0A6L2NEN5_TANCI|nr:transposase, mutator type [Tanacetum cinerariifolium]
MVVKLGYNVADLMYYYFLIPRLGLDYGLHPLNVDVDVLEMAKYVNDYKIILVYVEHESSNVDTCIFVTSKKGVAIAVDNHLRKAPIEIDSSPDVNRNLIPMCHRNLKKEWEKVSSKSLIIGEVIKNLSKKQPASFVAGPIVVESVDDPFEDLNEILGKYANTGKQITRDEITGKHMVVHVEVEVDAYNESEEKSDTKGNDTSGSDSEDLDYDPKHDQVFDNDKHIVEDVHVSTTVRINVQQQPNPESLTRTFRRVYVCLGALKQDFKACGREVLGLDGCFMLGPWPGQILTTVEVDANNEIYSVAYAIVEAETRTTCVREFNKKMVELKSYNSDAYGWLMKIPTEQWSGAHFSGATKCNPLSNNICEVFNRQLVDGRDQPIITCLGYIREYLMKRIVVV